MYHNGHVIDFEEVRPGVMEPSDIDPRWDWDIQDFERADQQAHREAMRNILAVCAIPVVMTAGIWVWAMVVN